MKLALVGMMASGKSTAFEIFKAEGWRGVSMDDLLRAFYHSAEGQAYQAKNLAGHSPTVEKHRTRYESDAEFREVWDAFRRDGKVGPKHELIREAVLEEHRRNCANTPGFKATWDGHTRERLQEQLREAVAAAPEALWVVEYPMLFEQQQEGFFDKVVLVTAPEEQALARWTAKGRDAANYHKIKAFMLPLEEKLKRADFVIENGGTLAEFEKKVKALCEELRGSPKS